MIWFVNLNLVISNWMVDNLLCAVYFFSRVVICLIVFFFQLWRQMAACAMLMSWFAGRCYVWAVKYKRFNVDFGIVGIFAFVIQCVPRHGAIEWRHRGHGHCGTHDLFSFSIWISLSISIKMYKFSAVEPLLDYCICLITEFYYCHWFVIGWRSFG